MVRLIEPKTHRLSAGRTAVFETIVVRPPEPRMTRMIPTRHSVVFAITAGIALCTLIFLNLAIPPHKPVSGRILAAPATVRPTGTTTKHANVQPQIESFAGTGTATPRVVAPIATGPTAVPTVTSTEQSMTTEAPTSTDPPTTIEQPTTTGAPAQPPTPAPAPLTTVATAAGQSTSAVASENQATISRLLIPAIGVNAPVEVKSIDGAGVMQAPDAADVVAWYDFSAQPGTVGNVVFAGHLDYAGVGPAVFWRLAQLQPGDEIDVRDGNGKSVRYRVATIKSYPASADASQIVASTGTPTITLITCDGTYDRSKGEYDQRTVITGQLVE